VEDEQVTLLKKMSRAQDQLRSKLMDMEKRIGNGGGNGPWQQNPPPGNNDAWQPTSPRQKPTFDPTRGPRCYNCQNYGHIQRDCPQRRGNNNWGNKGNNRRAPNNKTNLNY